MIVHDHDSHNDILPRSCQSLGKQVHAFGMRTIIRYAVNILSRVIFFSKS